MDRKCTQTEKCTPTETRWPITTSPEVLAPPEDVVVVYNFKLINRDALLVPSGAERAINIAEQPDTTACITQTLTAGSADPGRKVQETRTSSRNICCLKKHRRKEVGKTKKKRIGPTTGLFLRVKDRNGKPTHQVDYSSIPPPVCTKLNCTLHCCSQLTLQSAAKIAIFHKHVREAARSEHFQNGRKGFNKFLCRLITDPQSGIRPWRQVFRYRPRAIKVQHSGKKLCPWCSTCSGLLFDDCHHKFTVTTCPRYDEGVQWSLDHPTKGARLRYHIPGLHNLCATYIVSRSYFMTLFQVGKSKMTTLSNQCLLSTRPVSQKTFNQNM